MQHIRIKYLPESAFKLTGSSFKKIIKKIKKVVDIFFSLLYTNSCVTERTQTNPSGCGSAWLERLVWDQEVAGSNPVTPILIYARVAQWWSIALPRRGSRVRIPSRAFKEIEKRVIRWMALFSMFEPSRARTVRMSPLRSGRRSRTSPGCSTALALHCSSGLPIPAQRRS